MKKPQVNSSILLKLHIEQLQHLLIGIPIAFVFWPVLLPIWAFVKLVRVAVTLYLNWPHEDYLSDFVQYDVRKPGASYVLSAGTDSVFGYKKLNNCNSTILAYAIVEGSCKPDYILERVGNMVAGNPKLKQRFVKKLGFYAWESCEFDLRKHVRVIQPPAPANDSWDRETMFRLMENLSATSMDDQDRPQWEVLVLPGFRPEESSGEKNNNNQENPKEYFAHVLRAHHAYGDGVSFCLTSNAFLFDQPAELPVDPKQGFPIPPLLMFLQYLKVALLGPYYLLRNMADFFQDDSLFAVHEYSEAKYLCRSSKSVALEDLKELKAETKASVTAILMTGIGASLAKTHETLFPGQAVPSAVTAANVNAMLPYEDNRLRNQFTVFPFKTPLQELDLKKRLEKTNVEGYRVTMSPDPIFMYFLAKVLGDMPAVVQNTVVKTAGPPVMLSNIPGMMDQIRTFKGKVIDCGAWLPLLRITGIAISTYTYCGKVHVCGITDSKLMSRADLQNLLDNAVGSVQELQAIYCRQSRPSFVD